MLALKGQGRGRAKVAVVTVRARKAYLHRKLARLEQAGSKSHHRKAGPLLGIHRKAANLRKVVSPVDWK